MMGADAEEVEEVEEAEEAEEATWFKVPQRPIFWHSGGLSTPL